MKLFECIGLIAIDLILFCYTYDKKSNKMYSTKMDFFFLKFTFFGLTIKDHVMYLL